MDQNRVAEIVQLSVALASQQDEWIDRELGPIHLIKHVYLADLAYAEGHNGETYTGADWRFHKFGPWDFDVFDSLEVCLANRPFKKKRIQSKFQDDFVRWFLPSGNDELIDSIERKLPHRVVSAVRNAVRNFGSSTYPLLHKVYRTKPMINAKPGERLDFSLLSIPEVWNTASSRNDLSKKKKLRRKLKKLLDARSEQKESDVWIGKPTTLETGLKWLAEAEKLELEEQEIELEFDDSVWEMESRNIDDEF